MNSLSRMSLCSQYDGMSKTVEKKKYILLIILLVGSVGKGLHQCLLIGMSSSPLAYLQCRAPSCYQSAISSHLPFIRMRPYEFGTKSFRDLHAFCKGKKNISLWLPPHSRSVRMTPQMLARDALCFVPQCVSCTTRRNGRCVLTAE